MSLIEQLEAVLPNGMEIPGALRRLYRWIEAQGSFQDRPDGSRVGFLFPQEQLRAAGSISPGGTSIEFSAEGNEHLHYWFGHGRKEVIDRLCVFARTGDDGSMAALWLAEDGTQKIVHLGSDSGSTLVCVLAEAPIDFLRLLAIGYAEICWEFEFPEPPDECEERVLPNVPFQDWVKATFSVSIPRTASEIVKHPSTMDEADPADKFARWVNRNNG